MQSSQTGITGHYSSGNLLQAIRAGLKAARTKSDASDVDLLGGVDEFHIGGRTATEALADRVIPGPDCQVLDIGCGIGGTARFLATRYGCQVTGIDLTPEFVDVGNQLNADLGLGNRIMLSVADATDIPLGTDRFDRVTMLHVGMNIADKDRLAAEIARVLKPGGIAAIYDVMRTGEEPLRFPVPWARDQTMSFVATPADYAASLAAAGLSPDAAVSMRDTALAFFEQARARMAAGGGSSPLGVHLVMGQDALEKVANLSAMVEAGTVCPTLILAHKPV